MKAVFITSYGKAEKSLQIKEVDAPVAGPGEVLIETEAFGINFADVMARKGLYRAAPPPPFIPGYEVCGKIISTGQDVDTRWIGKRVASLVRFGGYAQISVAPVKALVEIDDTVSAADACALCTQYATAWFAVNECVTVRSNEHALVYAAAGGVGIAITQLLSLKNTEITALVGSPNKVAIASKNGARTVLVASDFKQIKKELAGKKFDVIFNPVYGKTMKNDISLLNTGGRLVLFGASSRLNHGKSFFSTLLYVLSAGRILPVYLMMKSRSIAGINMLEIGDNKPELLKECLNQVFSLYRQQKIKPVTHIYPVSEIANAHRDMEERNTTGKLVVTW